ncbi:MAG: DUF4440 domain-containing protein [Gemmatimonadota bacterium]
MRLIPGSLFLVASLAACAAPAPGPAAGTGAAAVDTIAIKQQTHDAYINAINSNNIDSLGAMLAEDVVFMTGNLPPVVGKAAAMAWVGGYLKAYKTHWDKPSQEFKVAGDWAIERYNYKSVDTPIAGGTPMEDTGWGLILYHHDADGKWRVSRDAWGVDHPLATSK